MVIMELNSFNIKESFIMPSISLKKLKPFAAEKIRPFLDEILSAYQEEIHSIYVTGSSITDDFKEKTSDINSLIVLKEMNLKFIESLAVLGKKYGRHRIAAPLMMTPEYIRTSLDVFPIEFLNFKLIHATVYGEDILEPLEISRMDLRHQCERELKVKLVALRQGYISSLGDRKVIADGLARSITGYIPLFRGIILLLGKQPPVSQYEAISALSEAAGVETAAFSNVLRVKHEKTKFSLEELNTIFEDYYSATEKLGKIADEIKI
ncbi:MAG: hypothetical protein C4538_02380 [Nitrospiraceae bacterium]|nr:MAG: hypothetical protein C4538_02380 [Nitrospiraceae bacterium]